MRYVCPVCGYPELKEEPYGADGGGSDEICPSCGIHFGYHDYAGGDSARRPELYSRLRQKWIAGGMKWRYGRLPAGWDPVRQLQNVKDK